MEVKFNMNIKKKSILSLVALSISLGNVHSSSHNEITYVQEINEYENNILTPEVFFPEIENLRMDLRKAFLETSSKRSVNIYGYKFQKNGEIEEGTYQTFLPLLDHDPLQNSRHLITYDSEVNFGFFRYKSYTFPRAHLPLYFDPETPQNQEIEAFIMMPSEIPEGGCPLTVIMHGSFGADNQHLYIASEIVKGGRAVILPRSFFSRKIIEVATNQTILTPISQIMDVIKGIEFACDSYDINKRDVNLVGFSRGGDIVNFLSLKKFSILLSEDVTISQIIPVYCSNVFQPNNQSHFNQIPVTYIHGIFDNYTPPKNIFSALLNASEERDVDLVMINDAYHGFIPTTLESADEATLYPTPEIMKFDGIIFFDPEQLEPIKFNGFLSSKKPELLFWNKENVTEEMINSFGYDKATNYTDILNEYGEKYYAVCGGPWKDGVNTIIDLVHSDEDNRKEIIEVASKREALKVLIIETADSTLKCNSFGAIIGTE